MTTTSRPPRAAPVRGSRQHHRTAPAARGTPALRTAPRRTEPRVTGGQPPTAAPRRRATAGDPQPVRRQAGPATRAAQPLARRRSMPATPAGNPPMLRRQIQPRSPAQRQRPGAPRRQGRPLQRRAVRTIRHSRVQFRPGEPRRRLRVLFVAVSILLGIGFGWIVWLQTARADELGRAGKAQNTSESVVQARRGTLFDRDGADLALSVPAKTIFADPRLITDPQGTLDALAPLLDLSTARRESLISALSDRTKAFVYVARQVDDDVAAHAMNLKLPGIQVLTEDKRILPSGDVASAVIGRTDTDGTGTSGLEYAYNQQLAGKDGERVRQHDREGNSIAGSDTTTTPAVPGDDLVLTIDRSLQYQVEQDLLQRVIDIKAKGGSVVVLDTKSGEILAMANVTRAKNGNPEVTWANLADVNFAEPGSVAKIFSLSATMDQGLTTPDSVTMVPGVYYFDKGTKWQFRITDAESHGVIPLSTRQILVHSSNIGTLLTAGQLPIDKLHEYLQKYGFGQAPGLGLKDEASGILRPSDQWRGSEKATVTYGYGYAASTLQLAMAANTIGNDGVYVAPKLVRATIDASGEQHDTEPSATHEVISAQTAATMRDMMTSVVCDKEGTGTAARLDNMLVAGKTGTSRKVQANGTYTKDDGTMSYTANFVGMIPAAQPKVTIMVSIDEPDPTSQDRFGGTAAAPLFAKIAQAAIHDQTITPPPGDTGCPGR